NFTSDSTGFRPERQDHSVYGRAALAAACSSILNGSEGRNVSLFKAGASIAELVAGGALDEGEATQKLWDAARAAGLQDDEIRTTLKSASARGRQNPRTPPERSWGDRHRQAPRQTLPSGQHNMHRHTQTDTQADSKALDRMQAVAQGVVSMNHPTARSYLINRGMEAILNDLPDPAVIGFHPKLAYWYEGQLLGNFPANVAKIQNLAGATVALHRTYLSENGTKADVPEPKKITTPICQGATRGAAVRLYHAEDTLSVAEGIETSFAVRLGTGEPVWSTINAGGMAALQLPIKIRTVNIWADKDRSGTGQRAAESLAQRLVKEGRIVRIVTPSGAIPDGSKSLDWLDVWNSQRGQS
ncbi:MAG: toprim domain-containing protein, partial [Magnetococcales bacterium]|nr:toprim domain-containing protein [Magnetococcales bacterium]